LRVSPGAAQVPQDGSDRVRGEDESDDAHLGAAALTALRIHLEDPLQKLRPPLSESS